MSDLTTSTDIDTFMGSANNAAVLPGLNLPTGSPVTPPALTGRAQTQVDNGFVRPIVVNPDGTYALLDQDTIFICMANTGSGVTKGQAVYINGINANTKPNVGLAKADAIATAYCLGFALDTVADGAALRVLTIGRLSAVTTPVGVTAGRLFLSDSVAGSYGNTAPTAAGSFSCSLGYCRVADSSGVTGSIESRATTPVANLPGTIRAMINGNGSVPSAGTVAVIEVPYDCTIVASKITSDVQGSAAVDIRRLAAASFPGTAPGTAGMGASIVASAPPTLSSQQAVQDVTLTGWTVTLSKGDWLQFSLTSAGTLFWVQVSLDIVRR
jgi:hypothetical protein